MDAQPDFNELSKVFVTASTLFDTASREIARIPNIPTFNDGQRLFEAINNLNTTVQNKFTALEAMVTDLDVKVTTLDGKVTTLDGKVTTLDGKVTTLDARVTTLDARVTTLEATVDRRFSKLEDSMSADAHNHAARLYNSHITRRETSLRILHNRQNIPAEGFPINPAALMRLASPALSTLFDAYGLSDEGNLEVKRRRFREFVGLVSDA